MNTKHILFTVIALLLIGAGAYLFFNNDSSVETTNPSETMPVEADGGIGDGAQPLDELIGEGNVENTLTFSSETVIGSSVNGTDITAYHFGNGMNEVVLIGGVHGSYAPNTSELLEEFLTYFGDESTVPANTRVTVIPTVNPDGLAAGGTTGRFNSNDVDLNRNFGCDWAATSKWRDQDVSGGATPYSEPEAASIRDYVSEINAVGAIVWFAAEGKVYPSACEKTPSNASVALAATFASAAGYGVEAEFDAYTINGDMVNWMASEGIPAISVLLTDRSGIEWDKNEAGVKAALELLTN
jgi:predicted deacylase